MTNFDERFGAGAIGVFPGIRADNTFPGIGTTPSATRNEQYPGFSGDGDAIRLPTTAAGDIDYLNNVGVSQAGWPITIANISAAHTTWLGFCLDDTDGLLYVCTRGATLTNFILSSINSAGTIVNIATVTITQPDAGSLWNWGAASPGNAGSCSFYRASDGSGDFRMFITSNPIEYVEEIEFSVTGTLVQDTIRTISFKDGGEVFYKTPNGNYIGSFDPNTDLDQVDIGVASGTSSSVKSTILSVPLTTGIFYQTNSGGYPMLWKGRIVINHFQVIRAGPRAYMQAEFERFADALCKAGGVAA